MEVNMNKAVRLDLAEAASAIEHLVETLPSMALKDKVDACARLRGAAKSIEAFDKAVKDEIKAELGQHDGTVAGNVFKAVLAYVKSKRLDQQALKAERPKIYEQYCTERSDARITFEPR
jgi:predicted phage-related endonuclease